MSISAALALTAEVAGCAKDRMTTGSLSRSQGMRIDQMSIGELHRAAQFARRSLCSQSKGQADGTSLCNVLQMSGSSEQALAVMRKLAIEMPKDLTRQKFLIPINA